MPESQAETAQHHDAAQIVRDHRLKPRIRHSDAAPAEDYECLCGEMFWGVAEWSYHVAALILPPAMLNTTQEDQ